MPRSLLLLVVAVVTCAMLVIELRHRNRMAFVQLQSVQAQRDALNTETGQLLLEEGTWAEHRRVEGLARERLGMSIPQSQQVVVVYADGQGRVSVAAGASAFTKTKGTQ
jgi:cell division protein FtsL